MFKASGWLFHCFSDKPDYSKGLSTCRALETCFRRAFVMGGFAFITGFVFLLEDDACVYALGMGLTSLTRQVLKDE